jgi:membrane associated rhomboid family serine protease
MIPIGDENRSANPPFGVWFLIAANTYMFTRELGAIHPVTFINDFALIPYNLTRGIALDPPAPPSPWLTLLTSQFIHNGVLHIAANMLFLFVFGPAVEYLTGTVRFIALYLLCGALASIAQYSVAPMSHIPAIGASGAIAGVLGAYILRFPRRHIASVPAIFVIGLWALTQFMHGFAPLSPYVLSERGGGTAYFAHIGGFLAGVFLIGFFSTRTPGRRRGARCA